MPPLYINNVPLTLIHKCPADQRIGQWIVNNNHKPASLMLSNEIEWRRKLFYVENEKFWKQFGEIVDPTK